MVSGDAVLGLVHATDIFDNSLPSSYNPIKPELIEKWKFEKNSPCSHRIVHTAVLQEIALLNSLTQKSTNVVQAKVNLRHSLIKAK